MGCHSVARIRAFSALRNPSPSKLNASTVMLMNAAGAISSRGVVNTVFKSSLHMLPQGGVGGATPWCFGDNVARDQKRYSLRPKSTRQPKRICFNGSEESTKGIA